MKKCCCTILAVVFMLAFATTTLASDFVLEFYLQTEPSSFVPIKNLHCMLIDSKNNSVLDEQYKDDDICKVKVSLEEGVYSLIVEEPDSHYFGNTKFLISSQSSLSMVFLLNKLGLRYLDGVHSCENNLVCLDGEKCNCDSKCVCVRIHQGATLQPVGQVDRRVEASPNEITSTQLPTEFEERHIAGQPFCSSCSSVNLYGGIADACSEACCYPACTGGGAWGLLGIIGVIGFIKCPKPVSEEPLYK